MPLANRIRIYFGILYSENYSFSLNLLFVFNLLFGLSQSNRWIFVVFFSSRKTSEFSIDAIDEMCVFARHVRMNAFHSAHFPLESGSHSVTVYVRTETGRFPIRINACICCDLMPS